MPKQNLSDEQKQIVAQWLSSGKPMLVEASAGSGKTRILTESVRRITEDHPKDKSKILCLTFTKKAAEEMEERLMDVKERTSIETTHSFALEIIKSRKHHLGMNKMPTIIDKESDKKEIIIEVILSNPSLAKHYLNLPANEKKNDLAKYQSILLYKYINFIKNKKQHLVSLDVDSDDTLGIGWTNDRVSLYQDYNALLRNQNLIDYEDIILLAWKILSEIPAVANLYQRIYRYVLVDEAQDLNFAQYEFIRTFCGDGIKNIMLVGDSNQAIYGYAGASSKFMTEDFVKDFDLSENQLKKLAYNYRSSVSVNKLANELISIEHSNVQSYYEGNVDFFSFTNEDAESDWVIQKIHNLLGQNKDDYDGELTLSKIAILGRNRFVFNNLISKLKEDSILNDKFFLKKGTEVLTPQSTTMKIFDLGIRILNNPRAYLYQNQLIDVLDIPSDSDIETVNNIEGLKRILDMNKLDFIPQSVFNCLIEVWHDIETNINKFSESLNKILRSTSNIEEINEKDLAYNDIQEWQEAWDNYVRSIAANKSSINDFRRFLAMGITRAQNQSDLTLATIHSVKGLEFHIVFIMGVGEGTFPDYRAIRKQNIEEEKNNAYVAVTRAKRELYITYPETKTLPWGEVRQKKSQFFKHKEFKNLTLKNH